MGNGPGHEPSQWPRVDRASLVVTAEIIRVMAADIVGLGKDAEDFLGRGLRELGVSRSGGEQPVHG